MTPWAAHGASGAPRAPRRAPRQARSRRTARTRSARRWHTRVPQRAAPRVAGARWRASPPQLTQDEYATRYASTRARGTRTRLGAPAAEGGGGGGWRAPHGSGSRGAAFPAESTHPLPLARGPVLRGSGEWTRATRAGMCERDARRGRWGGRVCGEGKARCGSASGKDVRRTQGAACCAPAAGSPRPSRVSPAPPCAGRPCARGGRRCSACASPEAPEPEARTCVARACPQPTCTREHERDCTPWAHSMWVRRVTSPHRSP